MGGKGHAEQKVGLQVRRWDGMRCDANFTWWMRCMLIGKSIAGRVQEVVRRLSGALGRGVQNVPIWLMSAALGASTVLVPSCREMFDTEMEAARAYDTAVWRLKPREARNYVNFKDSCPADVAEILEETEKVCSLVSYARCLLLITVQMQHRLWQALSVVLSPFRSTPIHCMRMFNITNCFCPDCCRTLSWRCIPLVCP